MYEYTAHDVTIPAANFATGTACVVDTGGIFSKGVNDIPAANLQPVSTTPLANTENDIRLLTLKSELEGKIFSICLLCSQRCPN